MAVMGVKVNRAAYRLPDGQREHPHMRDPGQPEPPRSYFLDNVRRFAEWQERLQPRSCVASMNMGWAAREVRATKTKKKSLRATCPSGSYLRQLRCFLFGPLVRLMCTAWL